MCAAFNVGIVNRLLPRTTNLSMHRTLTVSTNHYLLPGPPTQIALLATLRSRLAADKAAGAAAG